MTDEENLKFIELGGDDRFEVIKRARAHIIDATNIESSPEEMQVLDNFLFRCWQMGWLKNDFHQLEKKIEQLKSQNEKMKCCGNCSNYRNEWGEQVYEGKCCNCVNQDKWEIGDERMTERAEETKRAYENGEPVLDEERAEKYYQDNECYSYLSKIEDYEEVFGFVKDRVKQGYIAGLAEGRKQEYEIIHEKFKKGEITIFGRTCKQWEELLCRKYELEKRIPELEKQIEEMKCCGNCETEVNDAEYPCSECDGKNKWEMKDGK